MFGKKENGNGHNDNGNQLRTNLLSEDYGDNNNIENYQHRLSTSQNREQNQIEKKQNVELQSRLSQSQSSLRRSLLEYQEDNQQHTINYQNQDQIIYSRDSIANSNQNNNSHNNNNNISNNNNNNNQVVNNDIEQNQQIEQNQSEDGQVQKISVIFLKSLRQFISGQTINLVYASIKILIGTILLLISSECAFSEYTLWVILLVIQSIIQVIYNLRSISLMKQPLFVEDIAIDLHQIEMFPIDSQPEDYVDYIMIDDQIADNEEFAQNNNNNNNDNQQNQYHREIIPLHMINYNSFQTQEEDFRKVSMMVLQLKYESKKKDKIAMLTGYTQFLLYFGLQVWAIVQFFIREDIIENFAQNQNSCDINLIRFIFIIVFIGFFQYLDYYIIISLVALCSIFILAGCIYYMIQNCKKKRKRSNFIRKLKPIKYNRNLVREDEDCSICLNQFEESDKMIVLPCQAQHHFHDDCIKGWLKVNSTCPMCRTSFENY